MKYSIVLPVRNGGEFIKTCINSILKQSCPDFNLIVLENQSTDNTFSWLSSLQDQRLMIVPATQPLSIEENWGRIVSVPKNEFMTIIGHDDVLDKDYLSVMNELINRHPGAGLYQAHFRYIDGQGKTLRKCRPMAEVQQPKEVLHNFIGGTIDIMGTGFMMRSRDYDEVGGIAPYPNLLFADMELWIDISRKGYLAVDGRECFSYRTHPGATTSTSTDAKVFGAFERFVDYLEKLGNSDPAFAAVIYRDIDHFLQQYCQGISHKVLRTPVSKRQTPSVTQIIDRFREFGQRLKGDDSFEPLDSGKIRIGKVIDNNKWLHAFFLLFKRVVRKPVL